MTVKRSMVRFPGIARTFIGFALGVTTVWAQQATPADWETLTSEVVRLFSAGKYAEAEHAAAQALALAEKIFGADDPLTVTSFNNLAALHESQGAYGKAEPLYVRALAIREKTLGAEHADTAASLNNLALLYQHQGAYAKAEPLYVRALAVREKALGAMHADTGTSLNNLAALYEGQGAYAKAEPLYTRALAISEKAMGADHPSTATSLNNLAELYRIQGAYAKAEPLYVRALAIHEKALGADHLNTAVSLNNLALLYESEGEYGKAEPLYVRALAIRKKGLGPEHAGTAASLNNLAALYRSQGAYSKAEPLLLRALAIKEKTLGPDHRSTATSLNNLAALYKSQGAYAKAEPLYVRALSISEKTVGRDHSDTAVSLNNLGLLYQVQGAYSKAEPFFVRALAIFEKALGPDHPSTAASLSNLAAFYRTQRAFNKAEPLYVRALAINEKALNPDHPDIATSLNDLALLYQLQGAYAKGEPLYVRALAIKERAMGPDHPSTATSLNNLAGLYESQLAFDKAEPLYLRALTISEKALGANHPDTAMTLNNLAGLYRTQGPYGKAEPLYVRALTIASTSPGRTHPDTLLMRRNFALASLEALRTNTGTARTSQLLAETQKALAPDHVKALDLEVAAGSRMVRKAATDRLKDTLLVLAKVYSQRSELRQAALGYFAQATLHARGRLFEETQASLDALRRRSHDPAITGLLDQLQIVEHQIIQANQSKDPVDTDALYEKRDRLMADLSSRSLKFRELTRIPAVSEIASLLAGAAAVEFLSLPSPEDSKEHYYALVWTDKGPVALKDLGLASAIRDAASRYRLDASVADNRAKLPAAAKDLARLLLHPYFDELPAEGAIYFSPDELLAGVAFELLPAPDGKRLGDSRPVSLLGSPRDLARWPERHESGVGEVGFFDPDFGLTPGGRPGRFQRLDSTLAERDLVKNAWPGLLEFSGAAATKDALLGEKAQHPRILHLATQGFYQPGVDAMLGGAGIALAGANESEEKGVATATDMAGLDLRGTELVVLSACESGLSGSSFEDGLVGMQRSLTLAGARSQLLAMWKVPTEPTVALMGEFYKRVKEPGRTKVEALRMAKAAMRDQGRAEWEWAGFVLYGDPGALGK